MRIYKVTSTVGPREARMAGPSENKETETVFLVDAKSRGEALKHVARKYVTGAEAATAREVAAFMDKGVKVERAEDDA